MSEESPASASLPPLICTTCREEYAVESLVWRCTCGGVLDVAAFGARATPLDSMAGQRRCGGIKRRCRCRSTGRSAWGRGCRLVASTTLDQVEVKLDFLMPTLSFKDRGAAVLAMLAKRLGLRSAIIDSSGNAGTAAAAYFGRAGIACEVFVPASTSPAKLAQMRAHGAAVRLVPGSKADTSAATLQVAGEPGVLYASRIYHPYFMHGVKTYGYEMWEQCGGKLPDTVVVPVATEPCCWVAFSLSPNSSKQDWSTACRC